MSEVTNDDWKIYIKNMDYETLLRRWRFGIYNDPIFEDKELSQFFAETMAEKSKFVDRVAISRKVGW